MSNTKIISITTETSEVYIVRFEGRSDLRGWCEKCGEQTRLLMLDEAVSLSNESMKNLIRRIEDGDLHSLETDSGHWLVCRNSISNFICKGEI